MSVAAWHSVFEKDAEYTRLKTELDSVNVEIDKAWEERRTLRAKLRAKSTDEDQASADAIKAMTARRSELWAQLKTLRNKLKPEYKEQLDAVELDRRAKVKKARQESGLFWSNYNAVVDAYNVARSKATKAGATLRFHAFDGTGRFVNQIQGGMSVDDLFNGRHSQVCVSDISPDAFSQFFSGKRDSKQSQRLRWLTVTAYTGKDENGKHFRRNLIFPMVMHRHIPDDARIKEVEVVSKEVAGKIQWSVTFTCTSETESPKHRSPSACGLNFGWRQTSNGIRILSLADSVGEKEHFYLPESVINRLQYCEQLQSELDEAANDMRDRIAEWLQSEGAPDEWKTAAEEAKNSRSPAKLAKLALLWRDIEFKSEWREIAEQWRKDDKRKRQKMDNLRQKAIAHRRAFYQKIGKQIAERYSMIGFGQLDLKKAAQLVIADTEENKLPAKARAIRQMVGLYELTEWIKKQAAKTGAMVVEAERPVTNTCHVCGSRQDVKSDMLHHHCTKCGSVWDRDENACVVALQDVMQSEAA
jgi:predicted RNA-binding Zn-ribbon protein involved in translation (DUF1610 family)